jgi:hypothetical protein
MAETKTTITTCKYNSSSPANLAWNTIATAVPTYFDVRGKDGSKIIFLVSHETTQAAMAGTHGMSERPIQPRPARASPATSVPADCRD